MTRIFIIEYILAQLQIVKEAQHFCIGLLTFVFASGSYRYMHKVDVTYCFYNYCMYSILEASLLGPSR